MEVRPEAKLIDYTPDPEKKCRYFGQIVLFKKRTGAVNGRDE